MEWKSVFVFISSTFNDMHAERDYLSKRVFPELSVWCAERKLRLYDIDLRWGISEEDAARNKRVVDICLSNIDECRPFFLSFLGQRRGWQPEERDVSEVTYEKFPKVRQEIGKRSITELETLHALRSFSNENLQSRAITQPLFFFRNADYLRDMAGSVKELKRIYTNFSPEKTAEETALEDVLLERFKEEMRTAGYSCQGYDAQWDVSAETPELRHAGSGDLTKGRLVGLETEGKPLCDVILQELKRLITQEFRREPETGDVSELEQELAAQDLFLTGRTEIYIPDEQAEHELGVRLEKPQQSLILLTAPPGMGKTTFMANYIDAQLGKTDIAVIYRFLSVSGESTGIQSMISSIYQELLSCGIVSASDLPENPLDNSREFISVLERAGQKKKLMLFLDGLNQLSGRVSSSFSFLPTRLPENVCIVASIKAEGKDNIEFIENHRTQGAEVIAYKGFGSDERKRLLIDRFLSRFLKGLDEGQTKEILNLSGSENPLFLTIVLNELRLYGSFEGLMGEVLGGGFGTMPDSAFQSVLARLETDPAYSPIPPREAVTVIFGHLAAARHGLDESYFIDAFESIYKDRYTAGQITDTLYLYLNQMRAYTVLRDGRYSFLYESLKAACQVRYASEIKDYKHNLKAIMARRANPSGTETWDGEDSFAFDELVYQTNELDSGEAKQMLFSFGFLHAKLQNSGIHRLLDDFTLFSGEDKELDEVRRALLFSAPVLEKGSAQLTEQLWLRLCGTKLKKCKTLLYEAGKAKSAPWLRAVKAAAFDVTAGLATAVKWEKGEYKLMELDNGELFIKSRDRVYVVDAESLSVKQIIACGFDAGSVRNEAFPHSMNVPSDTNANRFQGITKMGRRLVFFNEKLYICDLDTMERHVDFVMGEKDFALIPKRSLRKNPGLGRSESWKLHRIFINESVLYVLFYASGGLCAVKSYDLDMLAGKVLAVLKMKEEPVDFMCSGTLAYLHFQTGHSRVLVDLRKGKTVRKIEEYYLQEDQLCCFDNNFYVNNQLFDGVYGRLIGRWDNLRIYYMPYAAGSRYMTCTAVDKNIRNGGVPVRPEELSREQSGTVLFWQKGDLFCRAMSKVVNSSYRWGEVRGDCCTLEMRRDNCVSLFDIGAVFKGSIQDFRSRPFESKFTCGFSFKMQADSLQMFYNYCADTAGLRLYSLDGTTLQMTQAGAPVNFEGSFIPGMDTAKKPEATDNYKRWLSRTQNERGRELCYFRHGLCAYGLTGDKLLVFHVDTQIVDVYRLPDVFAIDMPEGTEIEIWEAVLKRSGDKKVREKIRQLTVAQKTSIVGADSGLLYLAAVFYKELFLYSYNPEKCSYVQLWHEQLPGDPQGEYTEFLRSPVVKGERFYYLVSHDVIGSSRDIHLVEYDFKTGQEIRRVESREFDLSSELETKMGIILQKSRYSAGFREGELTLSGPGVDKVTCITLGSENYAEVFFDPEVKEEYVQVNDDLIFEVAEP
jgi:hypothetical protein